MIEPLVRRIAMMLPGGMLVGMLAACAAPAPAPAPGPLGELTLSPPLRPPPDVAPRADNDPNGGAN